MVSRGADLPAFTPEQVEVLRNTVAKGATDPELEFFGMVCKRTGLDPFARQIHFIKRKGQVAFQTGIDGYRVTAHRTLEHAGTDDTVFGEVGGIEVPAAGGKKRTIEHPKSATVTVYRIVQGQRCAFTATARWAEYYPGEGDEGFMWRKMPYGQLGKCAEALALRKAFSAELAGVYTHEEMDQAGRGDGSSANAAPKNVIEVPEINPTPAKNGAGGITDAQRRKLWGDVKRIGITEAGFREIVKRVTGEESTAKMTSEQMDAVLKAAGEVGKEPAGANA